MTETLSRPYILPLLLAAMFVLGAADRCGKALPDGTYTGTFRVVYDTGTFTGVTTLRLYGDTYECEGNDNRIPAGGSGSFTTTGDSITFHDENMWTADFDWNLIMQGKYHFTLDRNNLKLSRRKGATLYEYAVQKSD